VTLKILNIVTLYIYITVLCARALTFKIGPQRQRKPLTFLLGGLLALVFAVVFFFIPSYTPHPDLIPLPPNA